MIQAHDEASAFIRSKPALTKAAFNKLLPELKAHAFTIAGIECLRIQQSIRDEIATIPEGALWEDVKKAVVAQLDPYFVDPEADAETQDKQRRGAHRRAELLIRTHTSMAYAQTAYAVADEQRDLFPFWQYQTLGDGGVRPSHAALDGVVLPHDHPFWKSHTPPWDWGCRCQFTPLSEDDVDELRDQDKALPEEKKRVLDKAALEKLEKENTIYRVADLQKGVGHPVPYNVQSPAEAGKPGAFTWQPGNMRPDVEQLRAAHPDAFDGFEKWAKGQQLPEQKQTVWEWLNAAATPQSTPTPTPKPTTTPDSFATIQPALLKAARKTRDALQPIEAELKALLAEPDWPKKNWQWNISSDQRKRYLDIQARGDAVDSAGRAALHKLLEIPAASRSMVSIRTFAKDDNHAQGMAFIQSITDASVFSGNEVNVKRLAARAHADPHGNFINGKSMPVRTVVHELGHIIEARNRAAMDKSLAFRASRTTGETPKWLGKGYKNHELALEDEWVKRGGRLYSGKVYTLPIQHNGLGPGDYATEIMSMGVERLYTDPTGFLLDDPEYAAHIIDTLRGL